jgi:hypothetical protein
MLAPHFTCPANRLHIHSFLLQSLPRLHTPLASCYRLLVKQPLRCIAQVVAPSLLATFRNRNSGALHKHAALLNETNAKSHQC